MAAAMVESQVLPSGSKFWSQGIYALLMRPARLCSTESTF